MRVRISMLDSEDTKCVPLVVVLSANEEEFPKSSSMLKKQAGAVGDFLKKNGADGLNEVKVVTRSMLKGKNEESVLSSFKKLVNDATADALVLVGFPEKEISDIFLRFTDSVIEIKCEYIDDEDEQREYEEEQRALAEEEEEEEGQEDETEPKEGEDEKEEEGPERFYPVVP